MVFLRNFCFIQKGLVFVLLSVLLNGFYTVLIKAVGETGLSVIQAGFWKGVFGSILALIFYMLWYRNCYEHSLFQHWKLHIYRGILSILILLSILSSAFILPVAETVTLRATFPIFAVLLAAFYLRETVSSWFWLGIVGGFCGIVLMADPDFALQGKNAYYLLLLFASLLQAYEHIIIRRLTLTGGVMVMLLYMNILHVLFLLPGVLYMKEWPDMQQLLFCALMAVITLVGNMLLLLAFRHMSRMADIYVFRYLHLPIAVVGAWILLGESIDTTLLPGMILVIISSLFLTILRRKA